MDGELGLLNMAGTYIALRVHPESEIMIREFLEKNQIPIVYPNLEKRRHCTLVSTDDDINDIFSPKPEESYFAGPDKFEMFPTREGNPCLVLRLNCEKLVSRHHEICMKHMVKDRFAEFKPHISFSYDIGDKKLEDIPHFSAPIILSHEYHEPFNMNWVKKDE